MNMIIVILISSLIPSLVLASEYECAEHNNVIEVVVIGHEHVNHQVIINGKAHIQELESGSWFVEKVTCSNQGFIIIASHAQYNEPTKKEFNVIVADSGAYEIE